MAYVNRSSAYATMGNYPQVIADASKAIELEPKNSLAYFNRGVAYGHLGYHELAMTDFRVSARWGNARAWNFLRSRGIAWQ
jgi:tetratricopeptide (TPR) repeat protein